MIVIKICPLLQSRPLHQSIARLLCVAFFVSLTSTTLYECTSEEPRTRAVIKGVSPERTISGAWVLDLSRSAPSHYFCYQGDEDVWFFLVHEEKRTIYHYGTEKKKVHTAVFTCSCEQPTWMLLVLR